MATYNLIAQPRNLVGKLTKKLRKEKLLPGVVYGHGLKSTNVELDERQFGKVYKQAGESAILNLSVEGQIYPVLIQDVQYHYLNGKPIHVDFYAVKMDEKITADIPVVFINEAPAVKALGGVLIKNISEVEVECLPGDLPQSFEVDLSSLNSFDDQIRISDLKVSDRVKVMANPEEMIVGVEAPRSEEELKELEQKPVTEDVSKVEGVVKPEAEEGDDTKEKEE
jgi:large subunit ribosomal protein L25